MKHEKVSSVPPEDLPATPATGLTEEEAARRAEMGLDNRHKADAGKSVGQILAGNFFSLFNMLNFALNLLGCYVHDLRLQCLEFFGRFYKEGGKPFRPLFIHTKYVDIKEE